MEKREFKIEQPEDYHGQILKIVNDIEKSVRLIGANAPGLPLYRETHEKKPVPELNAAEKEKLADLPESPKRIMETPIYDENGNKIETPSDWFISGHNLERKS